MTIHHDKLAYGKLASLEEEYSRSRLAELTDACGGAWPDYENCIAGLSCSLLRFFGAELPAGGKTLPLADGILEGEGRSAVLLLLDGMGMNVMRAHLAEGGFFRSSLAGEYSSVFPPTTVAATTSLLSGLTPNAHARLGWTGYFPSLDQNIEIFSGKIADGGEGPGYNAADRFLPYVSILERMRAAGVRAHCASSYLPPYPQTFADLCDAVRGMVRGEGGKCFVYAYWPQPDGVMHTYGTYSEEAAAALREIEREAEKLCGDLQDALVLATADHGMIDAEERLCIADYADIVRLLRRMPSVEPRALNLFAQEGAAEELRAAFAGRFPDFVLYSKEELLQSGLLGDMRDHPLLCEALGDLFAVAAGERALFNTRESAQKFVGVHAGLTEEELRIPLLRLRG